MHIRFPAPSVLLLATLACFSLGVLRADAQVHLSPLASQDASPKSGSPEFSELPAALASLQLIAPSLLPLPNPRHACKCRRLSPAFFFTIHNHPLTPSDVVIRDAITGLARDHHQYIHVRLRNGRVLTGVVRSTNQEFFVLKTGISGRQSFNYSQLAEPPRAVPAIGTRIVHGLELTGIAVATLPLAIVAYPLLAIGFAQD
ncbi:MAG TPA: hypothetical protein VJN93_17195 [Candidatus Acidoferrum sp.]|nr:hypothetical protein [Candidatus Acidoferrum sp.]